MPDFTDIQNFKCLVDSIYSNYDHILDVDILNLLKSRPKLLARHAAYNFYGYIWFDKGVFHEQIHRHHTILAEYSNENIVDLISLVNTEFGDY